MQHLVYRPLEPNDIPIIQAMVQGHHSCSLPFGCFNLPLFVATANNHVVGFSLAEKGYGDQSDVLMITATFLGYQFGDEAHKHELHLAFINWAEKSLNVHRYKLGKHGDMHMIDVSHMMPAFEPVPAEDHIVLAPAESSQIEIPQFEYS